MSRQRRASSTALKRWGILHRCQQVRWTTSRYLLALALSLLTIRPSDVAAKNLDLLTRILIPGYIAQDFAALCVVNDPQFLAVLPDGSPSVAAFAQHLKIEITKDLAPDDAMNVMITAADTARALARKQLRDLSGLDRQSTDASVAAWCDASAKPFILRVVVEHNKNHGTIIELIKNATQ